MKVAISTENGSVAQHFGRCSQYTLAEVEEGEVTEKRIIDNPGHRPGFLPSYLSERDVDVVIAGGMGRRAQGLFDEQEIETIVGVTGPVDDVLTSFANGDLEVGDDLCEHRERGMHDDCR